jgi:electron transport complex protein RnfB
VSDSLYRRLQQQLNQYSMGFPEAASGIEIEILRSLFSEAGATLFTQMTPYLETPEAVAQRLGRPLDEVSRELDDMAGRGLLFRVAKGDARKYGAIPFVHGIFEFQVGDLGRDLAAQVWRYFDEVFHQAMRENGHLFLRTIPVNRSIDADLRVASYDDAVEILQGIEKIVVANCVCRVLAGRMEEDCGKPLEVCFLFGSMGQYYLDRGMGRQISVDEAVSILEACHDAGLVTQPASAQNPGGMCNCCGDCCGSLAAMNKHPRPATLVFSNYVAGLDRDLCSGCETCVERCRSSRGQSSRCSAFSCCPPRAARRSARRSRAMGSKALAGGSSLTSQSRPSGWRRRARLLGPSQPVSAGFLPRSSLQRPRRSRDQRSPAIIRTNRPATGVRRDSEIP